MNKKVLLFLAQGFEEYEAAVFTDVIGWRGMNNPMVDGIINYKKLCPLLIIE
jgi:hypothetical protein